MSDLTSGDPLSGGGDEPRHASGLPDPRPAPPRPADRPTDERDTLWGGEAAEREAEPAGVTLGDTPPPQPMTGYQSPPPPGAGGIASHTFASPRPGAAGGLVLASYGSRVGAAIIDALIVGVVALVIMAPLGIGVFASNGSDGFFGFVAAFFLAALVITIVALLYAPLFMAKTNGQTLGRMATGIRVVRTNGVPMDFSWALLREVAVKGILINMIAGALTGGLVLLLDCLWPLWDEENRALHDFIVQTRVVKA